MAPSTAKLRQFNMTKHVPTIWNLKVYRFYEFPIWIFYVSLKMSVPSYIPQFSTAPIASPGEKLSSVSETEEECGRKPYDLYDD